MFLLTPRTEAISLARGKALAGFGFPLGDRPPDLGRHLVVERRALGSVDIDGEHGASNSSSI